MLHSALHNVNQAQLFFENAALSEDEEKVACCTVFQECSDSRLQERFYSDLASNLVLFPTAVAHFKASTNIMTDWEHHVILVPGPATPLRRSCTVFQGCTLGAPTTSRHRQVSRSCRIPATSRACRGEHIEHSVSWLKEALALQAKLFANNDRALRVTLLQHLEGLC